ncbi:MAG: hypothetical protein ACKODS_04125 [Methylophilaceae bacterium]
METIKTEKTITIEMLDRILAERDARHSAELEKVKAELKLQNIETRLAKLEDELNSTDQNEGGTIGGFKVNDIIQAYMTYQQLQNQTK